MLVIFVVIVVAVVLAAVVVALVVRARRKAGAKTPVPAVKAPSIEVAPTDQPASDVSASDVPAAEFPAAMAPQPMGLPSAEMVATETGSRFTQFPSTEFPSTEFPSTEFPSTQFPSTQFPSTQIALAETDASEIPSTDVVPTETAVVVEVVPAEDMETRIAGLFVQLARRNQGLLERQIELIDQLEAAEQDPDVLDRLFRLDHLAARLRRNAESLLVLGGTDAGRRRTTSAEIADVVRVAVGAVEQYTRVRLVGFDDARVHGAPAADLAHLLAELIENATQFSAPDSPVDVAGFAVPDGSYVVTVLDRGIGMSEAQLLDANRILGDFPALGSVAAHSLGFAVVSRLAARHDMHVRLSGERSVGVSAVISVPAAVLERVVLPATAPALGEPTAALTAEAAPASALTTEIAATGADPVVAEREPSFEAPVAEGGEPSPEPSMAEQPVAEQPVAEPSMAHASGLEATAPDQDPAPLAAPIIESPPFEAPAAAQPFPSASPLAARPVAPTGPLTPVGYGAPAGSRPGDTPPLPVRHVRREGPATEDLLGGNDAVTGSGLTRRIPQAALDAPRVGPTVAPSTRSPEEVRSVLSRYRSGLREGRAHTPAPEETEPPLAPAPTAADPDPDPTS
jgi:hypothetical protein